MKPTVCVTILTWNEEQNLPQALRSVAGWASEIVVVDSGSTDRTIEIAEAAGCRVYHHKFEGYATQRNWALTECSILSDWVLFLDADEWLPDSLKAEIDRAIHGGSRYDGYFLMWRFYWMGKWIRRGYYPTPILRLFRRGKARCEDREINEHIVVDGPTATLKEDFIHEDLKGVGDWIDKHNRYSEREARELLKARDVPEGYLRADPFTAGPSRNRWLRYRVYNRFPPLVRPMLNFVYRFVLRGGFLDGKEIGRAHV